MLEEAATEVGRCGEVVVGEREGDEEWRCGDDGGDDDVDNAVIGGGGGVGRRLDIACRLEWRAVERRSRGPPGGAIASREFTGTLGQCGGDE